MNLHDPFLQGYLGRSLVCAAQFSLTWLSVSSYRFCLGLSARIYVWCPVWLTRTITIGHIVGYPPKKGGGTRVYSGWFENDCQFVFPYSLCNPHKAIYQLDYYRPPVNLCVNPKPLNPKAQTLNPERSRHKTLKPQAFTRLLALG